MRQQRHRRLARIDDLPGLREQRGDDARLRCAQDDRATRFVLGYRLLDVRELALDVVLLVAGGERQLA
ncbi:hypothetical protein [Burkholderia ambifaria]|uniref:hypothetical protein n=1 Tax=Burkholderia ambifaria TaxID=152480 RepID=UPI001E54C99D|nr:hypothetical protein [Burkholderia ambifaria]